LLEDLTHPAKPPMDGNRHMDSLIALNPRPSPAEWKALCEIEGETSPRRRAVMVIRERRRDRTEARECPPARTIVSCAVLTAVAGERSSDEMGWGVELM